MFKRKKLPSKPELTETNDFFLNTEIPEQSKSLFFGGFFWPLLLTMGTIWRSEFAYSHHLPFTIFSHLRKTTRPTGLRDPRAVCSLCDPLILMSRPTHFAWLPPVSVQQHLASWEDPWRPYIYIQSWLSTMVLCTNRETSRRKCTKIVMMLIFRRWSCVWFLFHFSVFSKGSIISLYYFYKKIFKIKMKILILSLGTQRGTYFAGYLIPGLWEIIWENESLKKITCIPGADSFWYLAKLIQFCKV